MKNGDILENLTAKIYERMGFDVDQNILLQGKSGSMHEIDVIARKKSFLRKKVIYTECKFRADNYIVQKRDLSNFILALDDLGQKDASFVTNSTYSDGALKIGEQYNLSLVDGDKLKKLCKQYKLSYIMPSSKNGPTQYLVKTLFDFLEIGLQQT